VCETIPEVARAGVNLAVCVQRYRSIELRDQPVWRIKSTFGRLEGSHHGKFIGDRKEYLGFSEPISGREKLSTLFRV
jgi:hypothetical protein